LAQLSIEPDAGAGAVHTITGEAAGASDKVSADLRAALGSKSLMQTTAAVRATAWDIISGVDSSDDGMTRAAAQGTALAYLLRDASNLRFGSVTVDDVARLLQGVARSLRYWAWDTEPRTTNSALAHWDVENEYHVQDMLGAILAPYFPDLDDEEWLKSLGQHHPRADFAIPSLNLIIEVKFLRQGSTSALSKLIQEVAADASTYLQEGSSYRNIIAFVWDDSASTEHHPELRQGLTRITGVHDAIILPRPAKMIRSGELAKPKSGRARAKE
jgi:REase_DpnII-MboI